MAGILDWLPQLQQSDIVGSFYKGQEQARQRQAQNMQLQQQRQQMQNQQGLRALAPQIFSAQTPEDRQAVTAQVGAIDPNAGFSLQDHFAKLDDATRQQAQDFTEQMARDAYAGKQIADPAQRAQYVKMKTAQYAAQGHDVSNFANLPPDQALDLAIATAQKVSDLMPKPQAFQQALGSDGQIIGGYNPATNTISPLGQAGGGAPPKSTPPSQANPSGAGSVVASAMNAMVAAGMPQDQVEAWGKQQMAGTTPTQAQAPPKYYAHVPPSKSADNAPSGYQWNADRTGLTPIPGGPADKKTGGDASGDPLDGLSPSDVALVKKLATYQAKPSELGTRPSSSGVSRQELIARATQFNPDYNVNNAEQANKFLTGLASTNPSSPGGQVNSANTIFAHLDSLLKANAALSNGGPSDSSYSTVNRVRNAVASGSDAAKLTAWNDAAQIVVQEVQKMVKASVATEAETKSFLDNLKASASPQERNQAISDVAHFAWGRIQQNEEQRDRLLGAMSPGTSLMTSQGQRVLSAVFTKLGHEAAPDMKRANNGGSYTRNSTTQSSPNVIRYDAQGNRLP